jgi:hypothetical protein
MWEMKGLFSNLVAQAISIAGTVVWIAAGLAAFMGFVLALDLMFSVFDPDFAESAIAVRVLA